MQTMIRTLITFVVLQFANAQTYPADVLALTCPPHMDGKVVEHPRNCRKYIYCHDGQKFYFKCYQGFVYDPCLKRCVYRDRCIPSNSCPDAELVGNLQVSPKPSEERTMQTLPSLPKRSSPSEEIQPSLPLINDDPDSSPSFSADNVFIGISGESRKPVDEGNLQVKVKTNSENVIETPTSYEPNPATETTLAPPPNGTTSSVRDNTYIIRVVFSPKERPEDVYTDVESESSDSESQSQDLSATPDILVGSTESSGFPALSFQEETFTSTADNLVSDSINEVAQVLESTQQQTKTEILVENEEIIDVTELMSNVTNATTSDPVDLAPTLSTLIEQEAKNDSTIATDAQTSTNETMLVLPEADSSVNVTTEVIDYVVNSDETLASYAQMMMNALDNVVESNVSEPLLSTPQYTIIHNATVKPAEPEVLDQIDQSQAVINHKLEEASVCNLTAVGNECHCGANSTDVESRCSSLVCLNGGMYVTLSNGHCGCVCPIGFKGNRCEQLTDPTQCYCANGGKCVQMDANSSTPVFTCQCPLGYMGGQCEYRIDAIQKRAASLVANPGHTPNQNQIDLTQFKFCDINPCLNGGFCLQHIESLERQCFCTNNWAGVLCQRKCRNC